MKKKLRCIVALILVLAAFCLPATSYAHGTKIEYTIATTIEIVAKYDSGELMAGAQVTVYSPDNPSIPWLTGTCNEEGRFSFKPDLSIPGTWDIQVRQAGHGDMIHIDIEEGAVTGGSSSDYSTGQIIIMAACVIFGIAGISLYFMRRKI